MKKKIILTLDSWYPQVAGPNVVVTNYQKYLSEHNDAQILVPSYGKKTDKLEDERRHIPVTHVRSLYVPVGGFRNVRPKSDKRVREAVRQADILHAHSPFALGGYLAKAGKKYGKPSILTFHTKFRDEFWRYTHSKALTAFMMRRIMRVINGVDYVWTVSKGAEATLREYGYRGEVTVIRNGTDMTPPDNAAELLERVNREYRLQDEENVLLFVGRVVTTKNLPLVFDALAKIKSRLPFKLLVVGNGEAFKDYTRMIAESELADRVIFTGEITDREYLKAFYLRADLFVFPSVFDTASLCPIEAAAFGLPTLLVEGSPTSETIENDFSGYAVPADPALWAEKIYDVLTNRQKHEAVRENCKKFVYRSWRDVVEEVERHYDALLK